MAVRACGLYFAILLVAMNGQIAWSQAAADGVPLNKRVPVELDEDLGFGKKYRLSMKENFQDWGLQKVSADGGHPVRLGKYSLRFETREGVCGWEPKIWSDCRNGRNRHELSTASYGFDAWNQEYWYAASVFIPENYSVSYNIGNSMIQFLAGGKPSWLLKFDDYVGFFVQREFDFQRRVITSPYVAREKWHDIVIRITHSTRKRGRFTLWHNGKLIMDHEGQTTRKISSKNKPYFKFGIYNTALDSKGNPVDGRSHGDGVGLPNLVLYYDEIRTARSCDDLKLGDLGYNCVDLLQF